MDNAVDELREIGRLRLYDVLRDGRPAMPVLRDLASDLYIGINANTLVGAVSAALGIIGDAQKKGFSFKSGDKMLNGIVGRQASATLVTMNRYMQSRDIVGLSLELLAIAAQLDGLRGRLDFNSKTVATENKPLEVRLVGMPTRETASSITRDEDGNIVASTQIERDAV